MRYVIAALVAASLSVTGCWDHRRAPPTEIDIAAEVIVTPMVATIQVGTTRQFTAVVRSGHGDIMSGAPVTWLSTNTEVASVDAAGLATGVGAGTAAIRATSGGVSGSAELTVTAPHIVRVDVMPASVHVEIGGTVRFTASAYDQSGRLAAVRLAWSSTHPSVVTVDSTGMATAVTHGAAAIRARYGEVMGEALVLVGTAPHGVAWTTAYSAGGLATLFGIWGSSADDIFAVGGDEWSDTDAMILRYDGSAWQPMNVPATYLFTDIWGTSPTNVVAVGSGIFHYDGSGWRAMTVPVDAFFNGVWGSSAADVYAVGSTGILHFDGAAWHEVSLPVTAPAPLAAVWGSSASDVFAVGSTGLILHYDGASWAVMPSPTTRRLRGVWGSSSTNVYAVSDREVIHYDGAGWQAAYTPPVTEVASVWGTSAEDVYIAGCSGWWPSAECLIAHFDGATWALRPSPSGAALMRIWGSSSTDVFIVGTGMTILRGGR